MNSKLFILVLFLFSFNSYSQNLSVSNSFDESLVNNIKGDITGVEPDNATIPETLTVQISGSDTHFAMGSGTDVWFSQGSSTIYPVETTIISNTLISSEFMFQYYHSPGYYDVNTNNFFDGHLVLQNGFYLNPNPYPPYLNSVTPDNATIPETLTVSISGENTNFAQGTGTIVWLKQGSSIIYPNWVNVVSNNLIEVEFSFDNFDNTGYYDVKTINTIDGELTLNNGFYLYPNPNPPYLTSVDPTSAQLGETLTVEVSGQYTNFTQGTGTVVWFNLGGYAIFPSTTAILTDELIQADFYISNYLPPGFYDVNTLNAPDGTLKLEDAFEVKDTIISVQTKSVFEIVEVAPNPNNGEFTVYIQLIKPSDLTMEICDLHGNILQKIVRKDIQSLREKVTTYGLSPGIYILKIYADNNIFVKKLIITR